MKTQHFILLLAILGTVVYILSRMIVLLRQAFHTATFRPPEMPHAIADNNLIHWNEPSTLALLRHKTLSRIGQVFSEKFSRRTRANDTLAIIDPVDGTAFTEGETMIRCACGTNYHPDSWQWLMEKFDARCVNCKRRTTPQDATA